MRGEAKEVGGDRLCGGGGIDAVEGACQDHGTDGITDSNYSVGKLATFNTHMAAERRRMKWLVEGKKVQKESLLPPKIMVQTSARV